MYNTIADIKRRLTLEAENQTLTDDEFEAYLTEANEDLFNELNRNAEVDRFKIKEVDGDFIKIPLSYVVLDEDTEDSGEITGIIEVRVKDGKNLNPENYELIRKRYLKVNVSNEDIGINTILEIEYIPINYKDTELAIAIVNILSRLSPFSRDQVNPQLIVWNKKLEDNIYRLQTKVCIGSYV